MTAAIRIAKYGSILALGFLTVAALLIAVFYFYYTSDIVYPLERFEGYITYDQMPPGLITAFKKETRQEYNYQVAKGLVRKNKGTISQSHFHREAVFYSLWAALHLSDKEKIEYLLNYDYFGMGCFGIVCAAKADFGKRAQDLTADEGEILVKMLRGPGHYQTMIEKHFGKKLNEFTIEDKANLSKIMAQPHFYSLLQPAK